MSNSKYQQWVAAHGTPQQVALRCRIVLAAAEEGSETLCVDGDGRINRAETLSLSADLG